MNCERISYKNGIRITIEEEGILKGKILEIKENDLMIIKTNNPKGIEMESIQVKGTMRIEGEINLTETSSSCDSVVGHSLEFNQANRGSLRVLTSVFFSSCDSVVGDSLEFNQANRGSLRV